MGPKLMNCCKPEQVGTKEHGKMLKRIQVFEDGRVPAKEARNWKIEGQKEKNHEKSIRGFETSLKWMALLRKKGLWNLVGEKGSAGWRSVA